jgi:hypothetical protein
MSLWNGDKNLIHQTLLPDVGGGLQNLVVFNILKAESLQWWLQRATRYGAMQSSSGGTYSLQLKGQSNTRTQQQATDLCLLLAWLTPGHWKCEYASEWHHITEDRTPNPDIRNVCLLLYQIPEYTTLERKTVPLHLTSPSHAYAMLHEMLKE